MGADIHVHLEAKINGKWEHVSIINIGRNYVLFGHIAGVRQPANSYIEPRGLPDDISIITKLSFNHWKEDGHTMSWLYASEMLNAIRCYAKEDFYNKGETESERYYKRQFQCGGYSNYFINEIVADQRYIFWFDN